MSSFPPKGVLRPISLITWPTRERSEKSLMTDIFFSLFFFFKALREGGNHPFFRLSSFPKSSFRTREGRENPLSPPPPPPPFWLLIENQQPDWKGGEKKKKEEGGGREKGGIFGSRDSFLPFFTPILWKGRKLYVAQVAITIFFFWENSKSWKLLYLDWRKKILNWREREGGGGSVDISAIF